MREINKVTVEWLEAKARDLSSLGVDIDDRVDHAMSMWRTENKGDFTLQEGDDRASLIEATEFELDKIRSYFLTQRNRDREYIGHAPFTGVFYYHGGFWEVTIPFVFGAPRINALKYLKMSDPPASQLLESKDDLCEYRGVFADSYDYAYSIEELDGKCSNNTAKQFYFSGDRFLRAIKALLYQDIVSPKALEDSRMAVEMFLKAYVAYVDGLDEESLRTEYRHSLEKLIDRCIAVGVEELKPLRNGILGFPDVSSRYRIEERTFGELWGAIV